MGSPWYAGGLSGICGGFFISSAFSIIADVTDMKERPKYYGYLATASAVGMLAGPLLAGILADMGMARAAYFVGIPLGIVVIAIYVQRVIPTKDGGTYGRARWTLPD